MDEQEVPILFETQRRLIARKQMFGLVPTYCLKCKKAITLKFTNQDGDFTRMCGCGCEIFTRHDGDAFHEGEFYTKNFIPSFRYRRNFKKLNVIEKIGLKKTPSGKYTLPER